MNYDEIIKEGVYDPHIFKAIFTAGAPGSGKSTISGKLLAGTGLKVLDIDKWWEYFNLLKQDKSKTYDDYWSYIQAQRKNYLMGRLGLIIDGTAKDIARIEEIRMLLENLGYDTAMIFVNTSLETSIQRVEARAKETGRVVPRDRVVDTWKATQANLGHLQQIFSGNFFIVDNNTEPKDLRKIEKWIRHFLNTKPTSEEARRWVHDELQKRKSKG